MWEEVTALVRSSGEGSWFEIVQPLVTFGFSLLDSKEKDVATG
jgi:hypothetical protein